MSEQETVMKKKKKQENKKLTVTEAIAILTALAKDWKKIDEKTATEFHSVYLNCERGVWPLVLEGLHISKTTWYRWMEEYGLDAKQEYNRQEQDFPEMGKTEQDAEQQEGINLEVELDVEQQSNTDLYHQVSSTLSGYKKLSVKMFDLPEKDKLIEMLQDAIKKLNGLLLKLESNIDDD